ncbi:MAG: DUF4236 domain-containing protein [Roseinatronobacter sp.]
MALRFRRTLKIAPGVRLNLTKTGISARVGPKGAGITVGTSGTTVSAGLPGTGLHVSQKLKKKPTKSVEKTSADFAPTPTQPKGLGFFGWLGVLTIVAGLVWIIL